MAGTALSNFTDFIRFTGSAYFTSAEVLLNDAMDQSYAMSFFLKGKDIDRVVQGGKNITDDVMFDESNTNVEYQPNATFTWTNPQVSTAQTIEWRFAADHMSYTDQEIELQVDANFSKEAQIAVFKRIRKKLEQRMITSYFKAEESRMWRDASNQQAEMEAATGSFSYSLPAFITEDDTNYHAAGWTTIMGIDPANESKWRNQLTEYTFNGYTSATIAMNYLQAFDEMWTDVMFVPPEYKKENFEPNSKGWGYDPGRQVIFGSHAGVNYYKRALRDSNDTLVSKQDAAYTRPMYGGVPVVHVTALNTLSTQWDPSVQSNPGTEVTYSKDGPRYWWINGNYLTPIYHATRYFYKKEPYSPSNQPFTTVCPVDLWRNWFCHSRQRQGIIAPIS